ncbi:MAG: polysaccharide pyruvyl transferase family protein [Eubacterium sp.]|nr:polysaccharide pyruvyl transferase family protein [Eubacterium sp.]
MKIGIITHFGNNYGNKLQNYAVQRILEKHSFEADTIVKKSPNGIQRPKSNNQELKKINPSYISEVFKSRFKNKYQYKNSRDGIIKSVKFVKNSDWKELNKKRNASFDEFTKKHLNVSDFILTFESEKDEVLNDYDFFVAGSDQIWNPTYPETSRFNFLTFAPEYKRIALAPSFGLSKLPEYVKPLYKEWLSGISALSVREEKGARIIKDLTGRDVPVLADPTLCLSKEEWVKIEEKPEFDTSRPYVFTYFLGNETNKYRRFIEKYANDNNCEIINIFDLREPEHYALNPSHFVYLIHNAKAVFTDSFHGCVFSLIMHTPFVVFNRIESGGQGMSSRIETLLKTFKMENRHFFKIDNVDEIDFSETDSVISNLQQKTDDFLKSAFTEAIKETDIKNKSDFVDFLSSKQDCCGCHACYNACPKGCISMEYDLEGFWYPGINEELCIHCNMCKKVCPAVNVDKTDNNPVSYLGFNKEQQIRKNSSSGGMFTPIAEKIIDDGGVVFGAAFNEKYEVEHIKVESKEELNKLRGSKYVQSGIGDTYKQVKQLLKEGIKVLFTGTPCQIEGLYSYLDNVEKTNLFTQDIICHGVPSPNVWNEYLKYISNGEEIKNISFRSKKYGWHYFSMYIQTVKKNYTKRLDEDLFLKLFLDNTILRPSCYNCKFKKEIRVSDFTLADCWRPNMVKSQLKDDDKGLSMLFVNSEKGKELFNEIKDSYVLQEIDYELASASQSAATSSVKPNNHRSDFFTEFSNNDFKYIDKNWYGNSFIGDTKKKLNYYKTKLANKIKR